MKKAIVALDSGRRFRVISYSGLVIFRARNGWFGYVLFLHSKGFTF